MKEAIRMVLESIYDPEFPDTSHFRSGRGRYSTLRRIKEEWGTSRWRSCLTPSIATDSMFPPNFLSSRLSSLSQQKNGCASGHCQSTLPTTDPERKSLWDDPSPALFDLPEESFLYHRGWVDEPDAYGVFPKAFVKRKKEREAEDFESQVWIESIDSCSPLLSSFLLSAFSPGSLNPVGIVIGKGGSQPQSRNPL
ncbi:hypothetical protein HN51_052285 [Arachis hypogaea]